VVQQNPPAISSRGVRKWVRRLGSGGKLRGEVQCIHGGHGSYSITSCGAGGTSRTLHCRATAVRLPRPLAPVAGIEPAMGFLRVINSHVLPANSSPTGILDPVYSLIYRLAPSVRIELTATGFGGQSVPRTLGMYDRSS
jgi:hypothetical protein